jgi:glycosyltransferase involved in cell wall biosynthesis
MREGGAREVVVVPNGTDPVEPLPPPALAAGEPLRVLFVGLGNYWPNEHGIAWMVREVLPRLRARGVHVVFDVVGSPPDAPVHDQDVVYHGRVPDLREAYERAHVVVAPLFLGSGTRLKVVETMAWGRPLVSTSVGAEGLPVRPGDHYVCADDPDAFADAVAGLGARIAGGDRGITTMLEAARTAVEPLFWPGIAARLGDVYDEAARSRSSPRSARPGGP